MTTALNIQAAFIVMFTIINMAFPIFQWDFSQHFQFTNDPLFHAQLLFLKIVIHIIINIIF